LDEVFVKVNGKLHYLWRAVDHEGEVSEAVVTGKRSKARTVADEGYEGAASSARALAGLRHGSDEVDEQPERDNRRQGYRQRDQAAFVSQISAVKRRLLFDPVHHESPLEPRPISAGTCYFADVRSLQSCRSDHPVRPVFL
jgi:hypothetical protein